MNTEMQAAWRKMVGVALLWVALACGIFVGTSSGGGPKSVVMAVVGFGLFAAGMALFAEGMKRGIVAELRKG